MEQGYSDYGGSTLIEVSHVLIDDTVPVTETYQFWNRTMAVERRKHCSLLCVFTQPRKVARMLKDVLFLRNGSATFNKMVMIDGYGN